jgi:hypothetical protein
MEKEYFFNSFKKGTPEWIEKEKLIKQRREEHAKFTINLMNDMAKNTKSIIEKEQEDEEDKYMCCEECDARIEREMRRDDAIEKLAWEFARGRELKAGESVPVKALLRAPYLNPYEKDTPEWIEKQQQIKKHTEIEQKTINDMKKDIWDTMVKDIMANTKQ